jgi:predicted  nucleic acid-binding Zn-ribbon protein
MGKNKDVRKRIAGQLRTISRHQKKIQDELGKPAPDSGYIRKWEREIDIARKRVRMLEERLGR